MSGSSGAASSRDVLWLPPFLPRAQLVQHGARHALPRLHRHPVHLARPLVGDRRPGALLPVPAARLAGARGRVARRRLAGARRRRAVGQPVRQPPLLRALPLLVAAELFLLLAHGGGAVGLGGGCGWVCARGVDGVDRSNVAGRAARSGGGSVNTLLRSAPRPRAARRGSYRAQFNGFRQLPRHRARASGVTGSAFFPVLVPPGLTAR